MKLYQTVMTLLCLLAVSMVAIAETKPETKPVVTTDPIVTVTPTLAPTVLNTLNIIQPTITQRITTAPTKRTFVTHIERDGSVRFAFDPPINYPPCELVPPYSCGEGGGATYP